MPCQYMMVFQLPKRSQKHSIDLTSWYFFLTQTCPANFHEETNHLNHPKPCGSSACSAFWTISSMQMHPQPMQTSSVQSSLSLLTELRNPACDLCDSNSQIKIEQVVARCCKRMLLWWNHVKSLKSRSWRTPFISFHFQTYKVFYDFLIFRNIFNAKNIKESPQGPTKPHAIAGLYLTDMLLASDFPALRISCYSHSVRFI